MCIIAYLKYRWLNSISRTSTVFSILTFPLSLVIWFPSNINKFSTWNFLPKIDTRVFCMVNMITQNIKCQIFVMCDISVVVDVFGERTWTDNCAIQWCPCPSVSMYICGRCIYSSSCWCYNLISSWCIFFFFLCCLVIVVGVYTRYLYSFIIVCK